MRSFKKYLLGDARSLGITVAAILAVITLGTALASVSAGAAGTESSIQPEFVSGCVELPAAPKVAVLSVVEDKPQPKYDVPLDDELCLYTEELCEELGVPAKVIYAMMYVESRYQPDIVNEAGDSGLLQLSNVFSDFYEQEYGVSDLLDPKGNILCGASLLARYMDEYELEDALMAYNCGPGTASELWAQGIHSTDYTEKVLAAMEGIQERPAPALDYLYPLPGKDNEIIQLGKEAA